MTSVSDITDCEAVNISSRALALFYKPLKEVFMASVIKELTVIEKTAKNGNRYFEVWCEITVSGKTFVRRFIIF